MKHKSFLYNNTIINYQDEGQGEKTIVLLHGFMNDLEVWASYVFKYMKDIRVVTVDLLGHGESKDGNNEVHSMEMQSNMIVELLQHINVDSCIVVGHSMGGYVALTLADLYPSLIKGLCLINSHSLADSETVRKNRERMCEVVRENRAGFIVNFIPELFFEQNRDRLHSEIKLLEANAMQLKQEDIIASQKGMMERKNKLDVLINAHFPILFIAGKNDPRIEVEEIFAQAMLPHHSEVMLLENVAHMAHLEAKLLVQVRLLSFLNMCYL
ncbi:MAG: alpha/beta hydrolase [Bacteroidales bacterium]|jgi:pimeloyl-ACP methyl ester carboxylesterase|nr:alpha/beta hydrolase [Bacteroidales bacterium]